MRSPGFGVVEYLAPKVAIHQSGVLPSNAGENWAQVAYLDCTPVGIVA
jgi:hypothetical protein